MRDCNFNNDAVTCGKCGFRGPSRDARRNCPGATHRSIGLGDMVAAGLSTIGITKERVSKAIGRPCGCGKRAEQLNELGRKLGIG